MATLLSWHGFGGDLGTKLSYTSQSSTVAGMGQTTPQNIKPSPKWKHVTYVYTGGHDGKFHVYIDGELISTHEYDTKIVREPVAKITATTAEIHAKLFAKKGKATVGFFIDDVDHHEWFQQRHWPWKEEQRLNWVPEGNVVFKVTDLKPGTRYYYRLMAIDHSADYWSYQFNSKRRWANGPGSFVTATEDGKAGYNVKEDTRKHFFVGANWGSRWYMAYSGPSHWFRGSINSIALYDYAMDDLSVRNHFGNTAAFNPKPVNEAELLDVKTNLTWERGTKNVASYNVYIHTDQASIAGRTVKPTHTKTTTLADVELGFGKRYFWRVDQLDKAGNVLTEGDVWTFRVINGEARLPDPAVGEMVNPVYSLTWTPGPRGIQMQKVYIAESPEELAALDKPASTIRPNRWGRSQSIYRLDPKKIRGGLTYYWRVDTIQKDGTVTPGQVWSFPVRNYYTPEPDEIIAEPLPDELTNIATGAKMMEESMGHPALTAPDVTYLALRETVRGTSKNLHKNKELRDTFEQFMCGSTRHGRNRGDLLLEWKNEGKKQVELYDPNLPKGSHNQNIAMSYVWRDIALVYDGKAFQYYVDGKLEREKTMPYTISEKLGKLTIGAMSRYGEVCLNEIEIFSKALSQKDIQAIAKGKSVAAGAKPVSVSFAKFTPGQKILAATNRGTLQGEFRVKPDVDHTPDVKTVDGVKCVWFDGKADFLQSAKAVPGLVTGTNPFTVELRVYSEDDTGKGAILALAPEVAFLDSPGLTLNRSLYFAFSRQTAMVNRRDAGSPMRWAQGATAKMKTWTTLKYVYEGGHRSNIKLYINGQLNNTISWKTLSTISGHPMRIGATLNTNSGEKNPFKGGVAEIKIYSGVKKD